MVQLEIQTGKRKGTRLRLSDKTYIVGRDEDCSIRLATKDVSRRHCQLRSANGELFVSDLGSQNGTFVNDQQITEEAKLADGDLLSVGPIAFRIIAELKPKPVAAGKDTSDDDIMSWLADEHDDETTSGETTVITGRAEISDTVSSRKTQEMTPTPKVPPPSKTHFVSTAEEAADIIRRHQEMTDETSSDA